MFFENGFSKWPLVSSEVFSLNSFYYVIENNIMLPPKNFLIKITLLLLLLFVYFRPHEPRNRFGLLSFIHGSIFITLVLLSLLNQLIACLHNPFYFSTTLLLLNFIFDLVCLSFFPPPHFFRLPLSLSISILYSNASQLPLALRTTYTSFCFLSSSTLADLNLAIGPWLFAFPCFLKYYCTSDIFIVFITPSITYPD